MNKGIRSWARPRNKVYVSEPQTIDTTNGNTFRHGFGHVPGDVVVRLVCITANNNYLVGDEIPIAVLWFNSADNNDGAPFYVQRFRHTDVFVKLSASTLSFFDPTLAVNNATFVTINLAQWKLIVRCRDIERLT